MIFILILHTAIQNASHNSEYIVLDGGLYHFRNELTPRDNQSGLKLDCGPSID